MSTPFEKARVITADYNKTITSIRANRDLTPQAKATRIAEAHHKADTELAALRAEYRTAVEAERGRLRANAFDLKIPAGTSEADKASIRMAHRDALDRVEGLRFAQDGLQLLNRAKQSGDEVLAQAVAQRAFERGWTDVLNEHEVAFPVQSSAVKDLWTFEQSQDIRSRLEASAGLGSPSRPPDAAHVTGKTAASSTGGDGA